MKLGISQWMAVFALAGATACERDMPSEAQTIRTAVVEDAAHGGAQLTTPMTTERTATVIGDPNGEGYALITINIGQGEVCWELTVAKISRPIASHIHKAAPGLSGPAVVFLAPPDELTGAGHGCTAVVDRDLLKDILKNSGDYYVNVHSTEHPAGAVRGQL